jgi:hypothetical protein
MAAATHARSDEEGPSLEIHQRRKRLAKPSTHWTVVQSWTS